MRRIDRAARTVALVLLAIGSPGARADDKPKPDPRAAEAVDRVLAEWQAKTSTITSVEVRFRRTTHSKGSLPVKDEGRAVLAAPNLAFLEISSLDANGKEVEIRQRTIWNGRSILDFDMAERVATRYPIREEWAFPPGPLRLPFFFRMTIEGAKRDHDWTVVLEDRDRILLKATPTTSKGPLTDPGPILIELERSTFRPIRLTRFDPDGQGHQLFESIEIKVNAFDDLDGLKAPCLDAWTLSEKDGWPVRLLLK